jgi:predicted RNA polymerase sigma factor
MRSNPVSPLSEHFQVAITLARNPMERRFIEQRIGACESILVQSE